MNKHLFFLAGLPRSGSTVLANILNQHPDIYASPTSALLDILYLMEQDLNKLESSYTIDPQQKTNITQGIIDNFYAHRKENIILDKHRGWPKNFKAIARYVPEIKIIVTIRPIADAVTSMIKLIKVNKKKYKNKENAVDSFLRQQNLEINTHNRAKTIFHHLWKDPYESIKIGLQFDRQNKERGFGEILHFVHYDQLIADPEKVVAGITSFLGAEENFDFNFNKIGNKLQEKDAGGWKIPSLHDVRPKLTKQSWDPHKTLGPDLVNYFSQYDFE